MIPPAPSGKYKCCQVRGGRCMFSSVLTLCSKARVFTVSGHCQLLALFKLKEAPPGYPGVRDCHPCRSLRVNVAVHGARQRGQPAAPPAGALAETAVFSGSVNRCVRSVTGTLKRCILRDGVQMKCIFRTSPSTS